MTKERLFSVKETFSSSKERGSLVKYSRSLTKNSRSLTKNSRSLLKNSLSLVKEIDSLTKETHSSRHFYWVLHKKGRNLPANSSLEATKIKAYGAASKMSAAIEQENPEKADAEFYGGVLIQVAVLCCLSQKRPFLRRMLFDTD